MLTSQLAEITQANLHGEKRGMLTVDSSHLAVIEAYLLQAQEDGFPAVVETPLQEMISNNVRPIDFRGKVFNIADKIGYPTEKIIFGIPDLDRTGILQELSLPDRRLLMRELLTSGFIVFGMRAADAIDGSLIRDLEEGADALNGDKPMYVIDLAQPSNLHDPNSQTEIGLWCDEILDLTGKALSSLEQLKISDRVLAIRVIVGGGYDGESVHPFSIDRIVAIGEKLAKIAPVLFGAQNIDHQPASVLEALVRNHLGAMRVGSELSYCMREALFALAMLENETMTGKPGVYPSNLIGELDKTMQASPQVWMDTYKGNGFDQLLARKYSLFNLARFFWVERDVQIAWKRLFDNFKTYPPPLTVLRQFMPRQYERVIAGELENDPDALLVDAIRQPLRRYSYACGWRTEQ